MILAAGQGTRLGSLGKRVPKILVDVGGRPLLERQLEYLAREGVSTVVVNAYHLAGDVVAFVDAYRGPLSVRCVVEETLLGTAGGVRGALEVIGVGPFVVLYGDVIVDTPLAPLFEVHRRSQATATLAVHESESTAGKGVVRVAPDGRVIAFEEKTHTATGPALINSGVYVIEPELVASLPLGTPSDFGHDVFPHALAHGARIFAHRIAGPVIDIGTPEGLAQARAAVGDQEARTSA
jgi:mannose-1-phosphate guanylyltransferase/phosphomannomutase